MLLGCCHCGPLDSDSSVFASSHESLSNSSQSLDVGSGCFCIGSVSSNTWRMDIDYGWNATTGSNTWCCAQYRKQKSYILRRVASIGSVCYWESTERAGTSPSNNPFVCLPTSLPRAWMAIHGPNQGYSNIYFQNGWPMSAGLLFVDPNDGSTSVLPYVYRDPNGTPPWGFAKPGYPLNCLTAKTLDQYYEVLVPNFRRWRTNTNASPVPCGTGFGSILNDIIPPTITLTPVNA